VLDEELERADPRIDGDVDGLVQLDTDGNVAGRNELQRGFRLYSAARAELETSVMNMWPGLWVIMNGGLEARATA